jgi:hypothetical protein
LQFVVHSALKGDNTSGDLGTSRDRKAFMDCLAGQEKNMAALNIDSSTDERKENIILTEDILERKFPGNRRMCPTKQSMHALRSRLVPKSPLVLQLVNWIRETVWRLITLLLSIFNRFWNRFLPSEQLKFYRHVIGNTPIYKIGLVDKPQHQSRGKKRKNKEVDSMFPLYVRVCKCVRDTTIQFHLTRQSACVAPCCNQFLGM